MDSKQFLMLLRSLAILSVAMLFAGCGGGGGGGSTPTPPAGDTTRPTVDSSSLSPANHAIGVDPSGVISVTFSEDMKPSTLTGATFMVVGGGGAPSGAVSTVGATATFTPDAPLLRGITYTATITTGVEDLAGNALATDYSWTFTIPVNIAAGANHTVSILSNGTLWAWGANDCGQLGDGKGGDGTNNHDSATPVQVGIENTWVSVAAGAYHTIALKNDGSLWAWGLNDNGQLGNNDITLASQRSPVQIGTATNWIAVTAGWYHTIALTSDGKLWAWGNNDSGQLGNNDNLRTDQNAPVQIGSSTNWVAMTGGANHSLALKSDGTLWAWGKNENGQLGLGIGDTTDRLAPEQVGNDTTWVIMAAGGFHTLAVKNGGTLWAWGLNAYGQLGDGKGGDGTVAHDSTVPVQVNIETDWLSVSGGAIHSLAVKTNGELWAWGANDYGQLGDGKGGDGTPINDSNIPLIVTAETDWASVASGWFFSLATKSNDSSWIWGANDYGQLGNGTTTLSDIPIPVTIP